ncbi:hypothetical protein ABPG72_013464 [Tetrahymena utriculariae]
MSKKVNDLINDVLSDLETYKSNIKKIKSSISSGDQEQINLVLKTTEYCLTNSTVKPIAVLNSLRLLKESMDTKHIEMINKLNKNKTILDSMFQIAKFDHLSQNDDRGSLYYGEKAEQQMQIIGNSLVRLSLECFLFWSYLYQNDFENPNQISSYLQYYESLVELGIKFPEKINYFKQALKEMQQQSSNPQTEQGYSQDQKQLNDEKDNQRDISQEIEDMINKFNSVLLQIEVSISNEKNDQNISQQDLESQFAVVDAFVDKSFEFIQLINTSYRNLEMKYKQYLSNLQIKAISVQKSYKSYKLRNIDFIKLRNLYLEATNKELLQIILEEEEQDKKAKQNANLPSKSNQPNHHLEIEEIDGIDYGDSKISNKQRSNISSSGFTIEDTNSIKDKKTKQKEESPRLYYYNQSSEKKYSKQQSEERKSSTRYDDNNDYGDMVDKKENIKDDQKNVVQYDNIVYLNKQNNNNNLNPRDSFGNYPSAIQSNKQEDSIQPKFGSQFITANNSSRGAIQNNSSSNFSSSNNTPAFRIESNNQQQMKSFRENQEDANLSQKNLEEKQMEIQRLNNLLSAKEKEKELIEKEVKINKDEKEMHKRENERQKISIEKLENQISVLEREKNLIIDEKDILHQKLEQALDKISQLTNKTIQNQQQMTDYQLIMSENSQLRQELNQFKNHYQEMVDSHEKRENEMLQRIRESEKEKAQKENEGEKEKLKLNEKIKDLQNQMHEIEEKNRILEENVEHSKRISLVVDEQKQSESKKTQTMAQELQSKRNLIEKYEADNERLSKQITILKDDMKRQNEYLSDLESQLNNIQIDRDQLKNKVQDLLQQLTDERAKAVSHQQLELQSINVDQKFQNERLEFNLKIEKIELENIKLQKDLLAKKEYIDQLNQNNAELNDLIQDLKDESKSLNSKLEQQNIKIRDLNNIQQQQQKSARSMSTDRQFNQEELNMLKSQIQELQNERNALKREIEENKNSKLTYRSANNSQTGEAKAQQIEIEEKLQFQQQQIDQLNKIIQSFQPIQTENQRPKSKRDHLEIQTSENQNIMHTFDQTLKSTQFSSYNGQNVMRLDTKATPTSKPPIYVRDSISEEQSTQPNICVSRNQLSLTQNLNPLMLKLSNITTNSSEQINQIQASNYYQQKLMQDLFTSQGYLAQNYTLNTSFNNTKSDFNTSGQIQPQKVLHSEPTTQTPQSRKFSLDQIIAQQQIPQSVKNQRGLNTIEEESSNTYRKRPTIRSKSNMHNYSNNSQNYLNLSDYLRSKTPIHSGNSTTSHSQYFSNTMGLFNNTNNANNFQNSTNGFGQSRSRQESRNNSRCDSRVSSDFLNLSAEQKDSQDNTLYLDIENNDYHLSTHNNTSFNVNPQQQNSVNQNINIITNNNNLSNTQITKEATFSAKRSQSQNSSKQNLQKINNSGMMLTLYPNSFSQTVNLNETENFATTTTNLQSSTITPSERQKCDFFFQQLIYPFQKPDDYYNNKSKQNNIKGQLLKFNHLIQQNYLKQFQKASLSNLLENDNKENSSFDRFRKACLSDKGVISQSNILKVGTLTSHHYSQTKKHFLKITVHFLNISKQEISHLSYINIENQDIIVKMNPTVVKCDIPSEHKVKVDLLMQIIKIPFNLPEGSILLTQNDKDQQVQIVLPAMINKFMVYKNINITIFKQRWQFIQQKYIFKSQEFQYSTSILKNSFSIMKYFPQLIELTPFEKDEHIAGISDFKVGGLISFIQKESSEYMLKFIFKPLQKMQIQFAISQQNTVDQLDQQLAEHFINTIYFLLKE